MYKQKDFDKDINVRSKMIEEMAKDLEKHIDKTIYGVRSSTEREKCATWLVEKGWAKIPEGAVVLTREQAETFIHIKDLLGDFNDEITWEDFIELMDDIKKDTRKETVDRFAEMLKDKYDYDELLCARLDEICKEITGEENANE